MDTIERLIDMTFCSQLKKLPFSLPLSFKSEIAMSVIHFFFYGENQQSNVSLASGLFHTMVYTVRSCYDWALTSFPSMKSH